MSAKTLMVMGTASDVGKSIVVAGLCRAFARTGLRVVPFKSQNMSNNAAVCEGGEIGRAQAVQAEASGLEPTVDMNPVLLKPESENGCQVIIRGRARFRMGINDHARYRAEAWPEILTSYRNLAEKFDLVIIEGAGSAAEINLRHRDIVNWAVAEMADAPVLLVADIDKGGVFASLVGTFELLSVSERRRLRGFLINKFRGTRALLDDGIRMLEERTGVPVVGVLPYVGNLRIPDEDSARLDGAPLSRTLRPVAVGVVRFPRISNYTDVAPLEHEPDVAVHFISDPDTASKLDLLILPGSKSTIADLRWLRQSGWEDYIVNHLRGGGWLVGICGGFQMLGLRILDPRKIESDAAESPGLGLLEVETFFEGEKITSLVEGVELSSGLPVSGYEIHAGRVTNLGSQPLHRLISRDGRAIGEVEGAVSSDGRIIGTSVHGLFDNGGFRRHFIDAVRKAKGLGPLEAASVQDERLAREREYDRFADIIETHADLAQIAAWARVAWNGANKRVGYSQRP